LSEGQRFKIELKKILQQQAGEAWSKKRKTTKSVDVAAVIELNNVSDNEDTSEWSQQTISTYRSSISSQVSNPTVCSTNVMCHKGIALEYTT
jgi:hypothetical protein